MVEYLTTKIAATKITTRPNHGVTASGYSKKSGAPTNLMIRLDGESRWRRLMVWQFSNTGTCFIRVKGKCLIVRDSDIPD